MVYHTSYEATLQYVIVFRPGTVKIGRGPAEELRGVSCIEFSGQQKITENNKIRYLNFQIWGILLSALHKIVFQQKTHPKNEKHTVAMVGKSRTKLCPYWAAAQCSAMDQLRCTCRAKSLQGSIAMEVCKWTRADMLMSKPCGNHEW